jgi:predicted PhzF superfamily epimerase YddE/YHI9
MSIPLYWVDTFADRPFTGNPAAVCVFDAPIAEPRMQAIAAEMNQSNTAFVYPEADGYRLRWFTPTVEVDLCGHATLASAYVLWHAGHLHPTAPAIFYTRSGKLACRRELGTIRMDFPSCPPSPCPAPVELAAGLQVCLKFVGANNLDLLAEVASEQVLRDLVPDMVRLALLPVRGIIVTATSEMPGVDFVSRFFAPAAGVPEDPVTGSAHCCLGPFWAERLGKNYLTGYQASRRGGMVKVRALGDRVELGGQAVLVASGKLEA